MLIKLFLAHICPKMSAIKLFWLAPSFGNITFQFSWFWVSPWCWSFCVSVAALLPWAMSSHIQSSQLEIYSSLWSFSLFLIPCLHPLHAYMNEILINSMYTVWCIANMTFNLTAMGHSHYKRMCASCVHHKLILYLYV